MKNFLSKLLIVICVIGFIGLLGGEVILKMKDNNTDSIITDDIIIDYKIN